MLGRCLKYAEKNAAASKERLTYLRKRGFGEAAAMRSEGRAKE